MISGIHHDKLAGFVANEHIDWTSTDEDISCGNANVTGVYKVDGTQVVKEQQAHIPDATTQDLAGGDTIDETKLESDLSGIVSTINSILSALENHGLLAK